MNPHTKQSNTSSSGAKSANDCYGVRMKEVYLYKKLSEKRAQCQNCAHYCVIENGQRGTCGVRENQDGRLFALNYGKAVACNIDPIEKKPFFHFLPGSRSLSIATVGCNFKCKNCQNWHISQMPQLTGSVAGEDLSPQDLVKLTKKQKLPSISYTYTEPAIFSEYALDTMRLAKKEGIKNTWVTNGFWSKELFSLVSPYLDSANVDLKSFSGEFYVKYCAGRLPPVLDTLKRLKVKKIWVEITTLIIPTLNDQEETLKNIAQFIKKELGPTTPWHVSQFSGAISWQLKDLPDTPVETLEKARQIGLKTGLKYVYTGNIPGIAGEDTYCPKCRAQMIDRTGYAISRHDKNGQCSKCGENLNLILN